MLLLRLSSILLAAAFSHARSLPRGIDGGSIFDQFRFMECNSGPIMGYYYKPPVKDEKPTYTNRLRGTPAGHKWHKTHQTSYSRTDTSAIRTSGAFGTSNQVPRA
jgi:hypothetical protein